MNYTIDSSVLIKGLVKPLRKKQDLILEEQVRIYNIATSIMDKIYHNEISLIIPTVAIVEVACVSSRLTGMKSVGIKTATFVKSLAAQIIDEKEILHECIDIAATTKSSGFDSVFITCAKITNTPLITDDKGMYRAAQGIGIKAKLLRDMTL